LFNVQAQPAVVMTEMFVLPPAFANDSVVGDTV
jgi:hypothetical protein